MILVERKTTTQSAAPSRAPRSGELPDQPRSVHHTAQMGRKHVFAVATHISIGRRALVRRPSGAPRLQRGKVDMQGQQVVGDVDLDLIAVLD